MRSKKLVFILLFSLMLSSAVFILAVPSSTLGQMTIPTRTPVPDPDDPTDPPPDPTDDDGGGNDNQQPTDPPPSQNTSTPVPNNPTNTPITITQSPSGTASSTAPPVGSPTATSADSSSPTATKSASATPIRAVLAPGTTPVAFPVVATAFPTAELCGEPPTFTTLVETNVYSGPGKDYDLLETLDEDETRPIVGRAIYSSWWLIQVNGKFYQAWVEDSAGIAEGNTDNLPEVPAPEIDGVTPTRGVRWDPTPVYYCDLTPTVTATDSSDPVISGSIDLSDEDEQSSTNDSDSTENQGDLLAATAVPLDIPGSSPTPNLLPVAGLVLIVAAVFVALFLRRNPGGGESS